MYEHSVNVFFFSVRPPSLGFLSLQVKETQRHNGATLDLLHQEWEVHESHRPGQKGGQEKGVEKEQEAEDDGESGGAEDERPLDKSSKTWRSWMRWSSTREKTPETYKELRKVELDYETKRGQLALYFDSVKNAESVEVDSIPLPDMPHAPSNIHIQDIPLPGAQPPSILKKNAPFGKGALSAGPILSTVLALYGIPSRRAYGTDAEPSIPGLEKDSAMELGRDRDSDSGSDRDRDDADEEDSDSEEDSEEEREEERDGEMRMSVDRPEEERERDEDRDRTERHAGRSVRFADLPPEAPRDGKKKKKRLVKKTKAITPLQAMMLRMAGQSIPENEEEEEVEEEYTDESDSSDIEDRGPPGESQPHPMANPRLPPPAVGQQGPPHLQGPPMSGPPPMGPPPNPPMRPPGPPSGPPPGPPPGAPPFLRPPGIPGGMRGPMPRLLPPGPPPGRPPGPPPGPPPGLPPGPPPRGPPPRLPPPAPPGIPPPPPRAGGPPPAPRPPRSPCSLPLSTPTCSALLPTSCSGKKAPDPTRKVLRTTCRRPLRCPCPCAKGGSCRCPPPPPGTSNNNPPGGNPHHAAATIEKRANITSVSASSGGLLASGVGATISAKPQIINMKAEVTRFVPTALRVRRDKVGGGMTTAGAHDRSGIGRRKDEGLGLKQQATAASMGYVNPNQMGAVAQSNMKSKDQMYEAFMREMEGLL
ncbi:hypothetical protein CgunFtcFv8_009177 [Champsocephalus gunnari]|uniref:Uncharacterized protein n=1 Tax=Champsocephalus gunnari TaxID=52237 RepID=A0AAN8D6D1_CHAGU|nr:hypothetical protein CgunFtcFv8_009177 [Champsocephalus gunnari]